MKRPAVVAVLLLAAFIVGRCSVVFPPPSVKSLTVETDGSRDEVFGRTKAAMKGDGAASVHIDFRGCSALQDSQIH